MTFPLSAGNHFFLFIFILKSQSVNLFNLIIKRMSIFGEDDILGGTTDGLNENIYGTQDDNDNQDNDENPDDENGVPIKIEPKKRSVRNLQPRLNVDRLKSDRGVHTIENFYKDMKFMGKGHEKHDLNNIMKRMEHWAHRLYPRFGFDDSLAAIEKLGKKKELQTHMTRYRLGMLEPVLNIDQQDDQLDEDDNEQLAEPFDEMDALLGEQILKTPGKPSFRGNNASFDSLKNTSIGSSILNTPKFIPGKQAASTPYVDHSIPTVSTESRRQLTSEQVAKIAENRRIAQERLKAKREALMAQSVIVEENSVIED